MPSFLGTRCRVRATGADRCLAFTSAFIALCVGATAAPAQTSHPDLRDTPPGSIIYVRDVPVRHAIVPGEPGTPHYVQASPAEEIFNALELGLAPLSDDVIGTVVAQARAPNPHSADLAGADPAFVGGARNSAFGSSSMAGIPDGSVGRAVAQGTVSIGSAMSSVSSALSSALQAD